jgi:RNA polymerase sigma factor (sigma-70 family)
MTETIAIDALKNGEMDALGWIYERHRLNFITWCTLEYRCNVEAATDMYQRVVMVFYDNVMDNKFENPKHENSLLAYFKTTARNKQQEDWRASSKTQLGDNEKLSEQEDDIFDIEESERISMQLEHLPRALNKLGDPCKTMLEMFYFQRLSDASICEKIGYSNTDSVKTGRYKCIKRLKKIFDTF